METTALAATLSLWTDLRPAFDAIYTGLHREALNRRYDWFERTRTGLLTPGSIRSGPGGPAPRPANRRSQSSAAMKNKFGGCS